MSLKHPVSHPQIQRAVSKLKQGNNRYTSGNLRHRSHAMQRRVQLGNTQHPFAVVVGCSDSRVVPEIIFDQGLGDLFVVRVAGNVINNEVLGSVEYALEAWDIRLVLVLGHQRCRAVQAAREVITSRSTAPGHIESLIAAIKPAVELAGNGDLDATIKANIKHVVNCLRSSRPILKSKVDCGQVQVIGGYYNLDTGAVSFLHET